MDKPVQLQMFSSGGLNSDAAEREADTVANRVMSKPSGQCSSCQQERQSALTSLSSPTIPTNLKSLLHSSGTPLAAPVRQDMESRFGYDFSGVRVHTDEQSANSASQLGARAFAVGSHIVFNRGEYKPESAAGQKTLAHELTHVLQQSKAGKSTTQMLSEADCAKSCTKKDGTKTATGKFSITVFADKEGSFLLLPATHKVGHAWIELQDDKGNYWSYGFWPKEGYDASDMKADVDGCVHHPDKTTHNENNPAKQTFELTAEQFAAAKKYAVDTCTKRPKYNLFGLQCTEFAKRALTAAGQGSAGGFGLIWESPNALASWIKTHALEIGFNITADTSADDKAGQGSAAFELKYRHQFYSLLGTKLRLYGVGRTELGSPIKLGSAGVGMELNAQKVYLPQLYVEAGGVFGDLNPNPGVDNFGAGITASAGLRYNIDELAFVGVEYNLVKDLVNKDPELHRMVFSVGFRLF
ncbi:eCIS core domain-containing protein [Grimontia celer]|uniref:eCIS core domain-containing protein n=1 Tax=Grimontia celer TaxID=1796497 RepID=UPI001E55FF23|nr:DUF4157 domain-containing protein [Grimontia celer]